MKRLSPLLFALPLVLQAHMVSLSTGEIRIDDRHGYYELRMPLYEIAHVRDPQKTLFEHIRFSAAGSPARQVSQSCREDAEAGAYICRAEYLFPEPALILDVECTLHAATVPNHVHLLRAVNGSRTDQAVMDFSFPKATLRFRPPTGFETAMTQTGSGMVRAAGGAAQLLFLASLVLAARRRRELLALTAAFVTGELAGSVLLPLTGWQPAPRFIEAAAALTIAYLAVEILLLPEAGMRWLVVGVLGLFHGLYFELFIRNSGYSVFWVLTGVVLAEVLLIAVFALLLGRIAKSATALQPVKVCASVLLVIGVAWFALRLWS